MMLVVGESCTAGRMSDQRFSTINGRLSMEHFMYEDAHSIENLRSVLSFELRNMVLTISVCPSDIDMNREVPMKEN